MHFSNPFVAGEASDPIPLEPAVYQVTAVLEVIFTPDPGDTAPDTITVITPLGQGQIQPPSYSEGTQVKYALIATGSVVTVMNSGRINVQPDGAPYAGTINGTLYAAASALGI